MYTDIEIHKLNVSATDNVSSLARAFICIMYLFAVLPVTDDIKSLKVRNIPLSATNLVAASDFGYW